MAPTFSICIPNFNYGQYLGLTLESVLSQSVSDLEILITDNASTDNSVQVIDTYAKKDPRISYKVNPVNIGFAGNLDAVGNMANGDWMIMLSSDDVMGTETLSEYKRFIGLVPLEQKMVFTSTFEKIDNQGTFIEYLSAGQNSVWNKDDIDEKLTAFMGYPVYKVAAGKLLSRCLSRFLNPFNFAATCYPRSMYQQIAGYGGSRLYNPDKWFHWRILAECDFAYYLDKPLFQYRWHNSNQVAIQMESGVYKFWIDEYRNTVECTPQMLQKAHMKSDELIFALCTHMSKYIMRHILDGQYIESKRLYHFALTCFSHEFRKLKLFYPIRLGLLMQPLTRLILQIVYPLFAKKI